MRTDRRPDVDEKSVVEAIENSTRDIVETIERLERSIVHAIQTVSGDIAVHSVKASKLEDLAERIAHAVERLSPKLAKTGVPAKAKKAKRKKAK
jgi:hypothetical protein